MQELIIITINHTPRAYDKAILIASEIALRNYYIIKIVISVQYYHIIGLSRPAKVLFSPQEFLD
jgi:hypothetical protein